MAISKNVHNLEICTEYLMHTSLHTYRYAATRVIPLVLQYVCWQYMSIFLVACHLVAGDGRPAPVLPRLLSRSRSASPARARAGYDIACSGLHMDLPDAEAGSFAVWFWRANVAIDLCLTEEQAAAGKQVARNLPRVLNNIKIRNRIRWAAVGLN